MTVQMSSEAFQTQSIIIVPHKDRVRGVVAAELHVDAAGRLSRETPGRAVLRTRGYPLRLVEPSDLLLGGAEFEAGFFDDVGEGLDDGRVELCACTAAEFRDGFCDAH
jgi:hypothetical protein